MKVVEIHHPIASQLISDQEVILAMGFFDGVHKGHQRVLAEGKKVADQKQLPLAALTFNLSPRFIFQHVHPKTIQYLTPLPEKIERMASYGVDLLYVVQLTSAFAKLSPQAFVDQYMVGLHADTVVAGFDYTYGKKEIANMARLPEYAQSRFGIIEVPELQLTEGKVGSTTIRYMIERDGDVDRAQKHLGYPYYFKGLVVHGEKRGRKLGFPTANLMVSDHAVIPKVGVYAVECLINGITYYGMASIGHNVTFGEGRERTVEVYLFDFHDEIYGEEMTVKWHHYLRPEMKFDSVEALIEQMEQDEIDTHAHFKQ